MILRRTVFQDRDVYFFLGVESDGKLTFEAGGQFLLHRGKT
jgi:hypothetical protein